MEGLLLVVDPVADIRKKPVLPTSENIHDELQETQVLFNEPLLLKQEVSEWFYVEVPEQKTFRFNKRWEGYPGWIKKEHVKNIKKLPTGDVVVVKNRQTQILHTPSDSTDIILTLSIGTRLWITGDFSEDEMYYKIIVQDSGYGWVKKDDTRAVKVMLDERSTRRNIVETARLFIGVPYLWGGRSMHIPEVGEKTGVDCSGLINLVLRANNIDVPRDAHEQWMVSEKIPSEDLAPGDLIFLSEKDKPDSINHVLLYTGGEKVIEAYETGSCVREIPFKERFNISPTEVKSSETVIEDRYIYFGRIRQLK